MSGKKKTRRAVWQTRPCPSWCIHRETGHTDNTAEPDARYHVTDWARVPRPRLGTAWTGRRYRVRNTGVLLTQLEFGDDRLPMLRICTEFGDKDNGLIDRFPRPSETNSVTGNWPSMWITPSEALDLAEAIRVAACMALNEALEAHK